jgi:hypothetical protein
MVTDLAMVESVASCACTAWSWIINYRESIDHASLPGRASVSNPVLRAHTPDDYLLFWWYATTSSICLLFRSMVVYDDEAENPRLWNDDDVMITWIRIKMTTSRKTFEEDVEDE